MDDIRPDFKIDIDKIPKIKIKNISFKNYKAFDNVFLDFTDNNQCHSFACFHGSNGTGKTTILEAITLIFSRFEGRDKHHLKALLSKSVRHIEREQKALYTDDDFLITAQLECSDGDYEVQINKNGFIKDHPIEIKEILYRLCYYARFDQELHQFQLNRHQWGVFKDLFESVTGFKIEEREDAFSESDDPVQAEILSKYVLGFWMHKPNEIISHKECSAGEKKIMKSFSTLLNKEYIPAIVCIDNAEMHVESGRHINLIESMKRCFPNSQIFVSTHSYQISKNFGNKKQLYDLRLLRTNDIIRIQPWRIYIIDEIKDNISKLNSLSIESEEKQKQILIGNSLIKKCHEDNDIKIIGEVEKFLSDVSSLYINDLVRCYSPDMIKIKGF